jgi:fibronectin type 3 domain-containing protein
MDTVVGEVPLNESSAAQLLDHSFEWEKTYSYRATVVTVIHAEGKPGTQFEGDDTPAVEVFAHDVFPPAVPSGLQAVFSGVGQQPFIDLIWAPDAEADLAGYNVFRHEAGAEQVKVNTELVKTPAFRDMNVESGKTYVYSISAVDVRGNESARSPEASEAVP